jgi:hypothetical protein
VGNIYKCSIVGPSKARTAGYVTFIYLPDIPDFGLIHVSSTMSNICQFFPHCSGRWVAITTGADSFGNPRGGGLTCKHAHFRHQRLPLFTSFIFPVTPLAMPVRILEKGEYFGDEPEALFDFLAIGWAENSEYYLSKLPRRDSPSISLDDIDKPGATPIPKGHLFPLLREDITEVQTLLPSDINAEIDIMEVLSKKPHPNICKYYGCIRDGDYVAVICLRGLETDPRFIHSAKYLSSTISHCVWPPLLTPIPSGNSRDGACKLPEITFI